MVLVLVLVGAAFLDNLYFDWFVYKLGMSNLILISNRIHMAEKNFEQSWQTDVEAIGLHYCYG
jgi:hypothetical protein